MHLLKTINLETGEFYYSTFFGLRKDILKQLDPEKKFELKEAEDGSKNVVTTLYQTYGNKKSLNFAMNNLHAANAKNSKFVTTIDIDKEKVDPVVTDELVDDGKIEKVPVIKDEDPDKDPPVITKTTEDVVVDKKPLADLKRGELDAMAVELGLNPKDYNNKAEVIAAIEAIKA